MTRLIAEEGGGEIVINAAFWKRVQKCVAASGSHRQWAYPAVGGTVGHVQSLKLGVTIMLGLDRWLEDYDENEHREGARAQMRGFVAFLAECRSFRAEQEDAGERRARGQEGT